jgi:multiple sugar transport system permease protein
MWVIKFSSGWGPIPWLADPVSLSGHVVAATSGWVSAFFHPLVRRDAGIPIGSEAAKIDGARFWKRVAYITLPMLKPVSVAVLTLGTIYTVKVFDLVFIMTGGGPANGTQLLSTYAYQVGFSVLNFGQAAAIATLMVLLVLLLNLVQLLLQKK